MLFNGRNRDAVADAAVDYLRLHGDDIDFRRPAFVVKSTDCISSCWPIFSPPLDSGSRSDYDSSYAKIHFVIGQ
jgi:hypothetical protein